ncbi:hypothetical protein SJAV_01610 [Sulfurisphaera javensis]|uniref:ATPase AAA-type core domain-containing protein n=1 Tax=Sulfurisphaera javensis TaxID=2049879 RepID=A0AAT9GN15_9CREN
MESIKKQDYNQSVIREIKINKIRNTPFFDEDKKSLTLHPSKINIIVGPNGSYKTSFLEALSIALLGVSKFQPNFLFSLMSTLRMDEGWFYFLAKDKLDLSVDDLKVSNASEDDIRNFNLPTIQFSSTKTPGVIVKEESSGYKSLILFDVAGKAVFRVGNLKTYRDFIAFSLPNPITPQFINSFLTVSNFNTTSVIKLLEEELDYKFLGFYQDDLGRNSIILTDKKGDIRSIQSLGSGISSLVFLILATVHDIVIYDNVENYLHPQLMFKLIDVIQKSNSQWFLITYSLEFIEYLTSFTQDLQVWRFRKDKEGVVVDVYKGEEVDDVLNTLKIDLRG